MVIAANSGEHKIRCSIIRRLLSFMKSVLMPVRNKSLNYMYFRNAYVMNITLCGLAKRFNRDLREARIWNFLSDEVSPRVFETFSHIHTYPIIIIIVRFFFFLYWLRGKQFSYVIENIVKPPRVDHNARNIEPRMRINHGFIASLLDVPECDYVHFVSPHDVLRDLRGLD